MRSMIEFDHVTKNPEFKDISFQVMEGEVVGVQQGCRIVPLASGLIPFETGDIFLNQLNLRHHFQQAMQPVGVVVGESVYPQLTGLQHLKLAARMYGDVKNGRIGAVAEVLALTPVLSQRAGKYGQDIRWRLSLAQALLSDPELLLIELPDGQIPLAGELLPRWREEGKTVLFSGSSRLEPLCDRVLFGQEETGNSQRGDTAPPKSVHCFFEVDQPVEALYALSQEFPAVSFAGNLLELPVSQEQAERVKEILYQRGVEVFHVTAQEVQ